MRFTTVFDYESKDIPARIAYLMAVTKYGGDTHAYRIAQIAVDEWSPTIRMQKNVVKIGWPVVAYRVSSMPEFPDCVFINVSNGWAWYEVTADLGDQYALVLHHGYLRGVGRVGETA